MPKINILLSRWHHTSAVYTKACQRLVQDIMAGADTGLDPSVTRTLDHTFVPNKVKRSRLRIFKAGSALREVLLAEAYTALRAAVDAAIVAAGLLMRRGAEGLALPECCQWPPFVSEALELPFAEVPFSAVYVDRPEAA